MTLRFHWRCLEASDVTEVDPSATRHDPGRGAVDLSAQGLFCREAAELGIDSLLMNVGFAVPDPLLLSAGLAAQTDRIRFLVAVRPGVISPTLLVQLVNTFSQIFPDRLSLNIVAGHSPTEQGAYGDAADHDRRYERMDEFLTVCRALWEHEAPVNFEGRHYTIREARLHTRFLPAAAGRPPIYVGGNSEACRHVARRHADVWMRFPAPPDELGASILPLLRDGREVGLRMAVLARATRDEALEAARALVPDRPDEKTSDEDAFVRRSDSQSIRQVFALGAREWLSPALWTGAVRRYGAPSVVILGSYDEVAEQIRELAELGISQYILHGWPKWDEMRRFGTEVLPRVRSRNA